MTVTDTLTVELTFVTHFDGEEEMNNCMMNEKQYEAFFKCLDGMAADDAHVKNLKHFVSEKD